MISDLDTTEFAPELTQIEKDAKNCPVEMATSIINLIAAILVLLGVVVPMFKKKSVFLGLQNFAFLKRIFDVRRFRMLMDHFGNIKKTKILRAEGF